jgi:hypothetical protein
LSERSTSEVSAARPRPVRRTCSSTSREISPTRSPACCGDMRSGSGGVGTSSDASCATRSLDRARLGPLVDAVERRHLARLEQRRDRLVGGDHQVLDQPVRLGLLARHEPVTWPSREKSNSGSTDSIAERAARLRAPRAAPPPTRGRPPAAPPTAPRPRSEPAKTRSTCG